MTGDHQVAQAEKNTSMRYRVVGVLIAGVTFLVTVGCDFGGYNERVKTRGDQLRSGRDIESSPLDADGGSARENAGS
jgi:hypothetical protein